MRRKGQDTQSLLKITFIVISNPIIILLHTSLYYVFILRISNLTFFSNPFIYNSITGEEKEEEFVLEKDQTF